MAVPILDLPALPEIERGLEEEAFALNELLEATNSCGEDRRIVERQQLERTILQQFGNDVHGHTTNNRITSMGRRIRIILRMILRR